jgi:hypothetical protein
MTSSEFQALAKSWKALRTQLNLAIYLGGVNQSSIHAQIRGLVTIARDEVFGVGDEVNTLQIKLDGCKYSFLHPDETLPAFVNPLKIECPDGEICLILTNQSIN